jgi:catechol 2,3-dioxygenase-like lactoylglutathione lyase family enzyme
MTPSLHHVGIVMPSEDEAAAFIAQMGYEEDYRGTVEKWQALCIFLRCCGPTAIELVIPSGGPLAKFNRGFGGVHHYAIEVPDIVSTQAALAGQGISFIEDQPLKGAGNFLCNFIKPAFTRGVMIEYVQVLG